MHLLALIWYGLSMALVGQISIHLWQDPQWSIISLSLFRSISKKIEDKNNQEPNSFETIAASSGIINVYEKSHGRSTSDTVRFRGPIWTSSDSDAYQNPTDFDGISGSNVAKAAGYSITVGKRDSSGNITNTDDYYHFTVDTNTATSGGVSGGGNSCSAGPATITA